MGIGKRIKEAREKKQLTQEELGRLIGVTGSAITNYEKETSHPKEPVMYALIDALGVDANFLFQDCVNITDKSPSPEEKEHMKKYRALDKHGKEIVDTNLDIEYRRCESIRKAKEAQEQFDMEAADDNSPVVVLRQPYAQVAAAEGAGAFLLDDGYDEVTVCLNEYTQKADEILKVVGRSMQPRIMDGDRILVRIQPSVNIGEIGVFVLDGEGFLKQSGENELVSLNPDIADVMIGDQQKVECYGKFISVLKPEWIV